MAAAADRVAPALAGRHPLASALRRRSAFWAGALGLALGFGCSTQGAGSNSEGSGGETGAGGSRSSGTGGSGAGGAATGTGGTTGGVGGSGASGRTGAGGATPGTGGATQPMNEYWIGPNGSNSNPGTQAAPFASVAFAELNARPGVTFWILPGTYSVSTTTRITINGTAANPINLFAAPGARPIFDYGAQAKVAANRALELSADYWHLRGFEVKNAGDNCLNISGSHNTVEEVITDFCADTGIQITVPSTQAGDATRGAFNTILNCDSHDNYDAATNGENADGIDAKLAIGPGNVFRGCRSWNNSDDGYDLFGVTQVVTIDNCWAMLNGHTAAGLRGPAADGNGFKLGGDNTPAAHVVTNSFAMTNDQCGFTLNNNASQPRVTACGVFQNRTTWCDGLQHSGDITFSMTGAQAIAAARRTGVAAGQSTLPPIP